MWELSTSFQVLMVWVQFAYVQKCLGIPTLVVNPASANERKSVMSLKEITSIYGHLVNIKQKKIKQTNHGTQKQTSRKGEWETAAITLQHILGKPLGCKCIGTLAEEKLRLPAALLVFSASDISMKRSRSFFLTFLGLLFLRKPLKKQFIHILCHRYSSRIQLAQNKFISKLEMQRCRRERLVG